MIIHVAKDFILSYTLYDVKLDLFPNIAIKHEVGDSFPAILCKIEKQMFDAWGISIFVGFDFHNVDALRLKSRKELLTLLFRKLLILRIYSINIVCHNRCFLFIK